MVVLAQEEARTLRYNYIGTEHILLGLLRVEDGLAAQVLESLGITLERARAQVIRIVGSGEGDQQGQIPFTPRAKKILELSLREALSLGHNYIGPEHILLGLVRENEGVGSRVLNDFDADSEKIRNAMEQLLPGPQAMERGSATIGRSADEFRLVVGPDSELRRLLMAAGGRALSNQRHEFSLFDLLAAADEAGALPEPSDPETGEPE